MTRPPLPKAVEDDDRSSQQPGAESSLKSGNKADAALNVNRGAVRLPSPDPSILSIDDSNNIRYGRNPDYVPARDGRRHASRSPRPSRGVQGSVHRFWIANKGLALVLVSQLFGTLMNVTTRMLEMEGNHGTAAAQFHVHQSLNASSLRQRLSSLPDSIR